MMSNVVVGRFILYIAAPQLAWCPGQWHPVSDQHRGTRRRGLTPFLPRLRPPHCSAGRGNFIGYLRITPEFLFLPLMRFPGDSISARAVSFNMMPASVSFTAQEPEEINGVILFIYLVELFARRRSQFQRLAI